MRVAVLEDDPEWAGIVGDAINRMGWKMQWFATGEKLLEGFRPKQFNLLIADIRLGHRELTGIDWVRLLRARGIATPVLMLTNYPIDFRETDSLYAGADDYILKPFDRDILIARLHALHRRASADPSVVTNGLLSVSRHHRKAYFDGRPIKLTKQSYDILEVLCIARGEIVDYETLWNAVWPDQGGTGLRPEVMHPAVARLRAELRNTLGTKEIILNVKGRGYRIDIEAASSL